MTKPVRVGLVGAGNIAQVAQLPALATDSSVVIAGLVTLTAESADRNLRRWPIERAYPSLEVMIEAAALDAVFVLTPRHLHTGYVERALLAGLDVFCEKPLSPSVVEAEHLADLAQANDRILMVGFNRRYAAVYEKARAAFGEGVAEMCVAQKNRAGSEYRATLENAVHMVDLLRWFCGEPAQVAAHAIAPEAFQERGTMALIEFTSGSIGTLVAARMAGEWDERLDAYGGGVSARVISPDSVVISRDRAISELHEARPAALGWASATETMGFAPEVRHFLSCVRNRSEPRTSGWDAVETQRLLDQILMAARLPLAESPDRPWTSHAG